MHQSVRDAFIRFNQPLESIVTFMYLDVKNFVTTGMGNLIDPVEAAVALPFMIGEDLASDEAIRDEWRLVKSRTDLSPKGGMAFKGITKLRLTEESIRQLVEQRLNANENFLRNVKEFSDLDTWPADAQLGLFSLAWAVGPGFALTFPSFRKAVANRDWNAAAIESHMNEVGNPGLRPRNVADAKLFGLAKNVDEEGGPIEVLRFFDAE